MALEKLVTRAEELQEELDKEMEEVKHVHLRTQLKMAQSNVSGAIRLIKEAMRTQAEVAKNKE